MLQIVQKDGRVFVRFASQFFNTAIPGFTVNEPADKVAPLLISRNPDASISSSAIFSTNISCNAYNMSSLPTCEPGFVLDPISSWCFQVLDQERNFWQASDACLVLGSELVEFENDLDVKGLIQLLQTGMKSSNNILVISRI